MNDQPRLSHLFAHVRDLGAMRHFYVDQLGLQILANEDGYLRIGGAEGFTMGLEEFAPGTPAEGFEINVQVADVDTTYLRLSSDGVSFLAAPADMPWGVRECWLRDPSGMRVGLFTPSHGRSRSLSTAGSSS